ncbi:MAG: DUF503 domain-containing protein [Candidatus Omnitrophota bacterium]
MIHAGVLKVGFEIPESASLKDEIRRLFNVSVSEVANHDKWQMSTFGISSISNDKKHIDSSFSKVKNYFDRERNNVIVNYQMEIL